MTKRSFLFMSLVCFLFMLGCSMTLGVRGQMEDGTEFFTGSATGYMNGSGNLVLISKTGVVCKGQFVYVNSREGEGVISSSDGRVGKFKFVSTGTNGNGSGELGGKKFVFTFGGDIPVQKLPQETKESETSNQISKQA